MTISSRDMKRLWADSSPLHGRNHKAWLVEALNALRSTGDPGKAMDLLQSMRRDGGSDQERRAIDDVVGWLQRRLRSAPRPDTTRLLLELGWLRRMSVIRVAQNDAGRG